MRSKRKKRKAQRAFRSFIINRLIRATLSALAALLLSITIINAGTRFEYTPIEFPKHTEEPAEPSPASTPSPTAPTTAPTPTPTPEPTPPPEDEVNAIARVLSGECYEGNPEDKRLVAEVIVNRASTGRFGKSIIACIEAPNQFMGYWNPSRKISENDLEIATQTLIDWYENDCKKLSDILYFSSGANRQNVFR
ncbi:MAG: cell wall hydrolase [Clostridiales bacterium]|jgi:hypothetical protein|nr:cell wall hydrolase [Clostridiales bacterium]